MSVPVPTPRALGRVIRAHRQEHGLTIEALADKAGVHPTYLSDIERGRGNPSVAKLTDLAVALETRVSQLIYEAES
ncbi:MAG TPA: helix-turn-helix transcriptional regulator [Solirubrobacteraceae bacterium]